MIIHGTPALQQTPPRPRGQQDTADQLRAGESGTMMLDGLGRILSCDEPAEKLFGVRQIELIGRWISDFIVGLLLEGRSPSYDARYLAHLCREGGWREFGAINTAGITFVIDLNLSRAETRSREIFLLNVRRAGDAPCP